MELDNDSADLINLAMDSMGVAVTIIDAQGTLLYYNRYAAEILDRESDYIGTDVHSHHEKDTSNWKLDSMLQEFQKGRKEPFCYEAEPYGRVVIVTLSPIRKDGEFLGCVQSVLLKDCVLSGK
jgi:PAS domain-containing protein